MSEFAQKTQDDQGFVVGFPGRRDAAADAALAAYAGTATATAVSRARDRTFLCIVGYPLGFSDVSDDTRG